MTYRDKIKESLDLVKEEEIKDDEGNVIQESMNILPICFPELLTSMAIILIASAKTFCETTANCNYSINGIEQHNIKGEVTIENILSVLSHNDFLRSALLSAQLNGFLKYLLEQEASELTIKDGEYSAWFDFQTVGQLWNDFAKSEIDRQNQRW